MKDWSEESIRNNCPFCDRHSDAYNFILESTSHFTVVADTYPITSGHLLIIPNEHTSCIGAYSSVQSEEFIKLYEKFATFLRSEYGTVSTFEHGVLGQSVFHSHTQLFPFDGMPKDIIPEGNEHIAKFTDFKDLAKEFEKHKGYLFFSIDDTKWLADRQLVEPRFFRDRFANAIGHPERGNWKEMRTKPEVMDWALQAKNDTLTKFEKYSSH